MESGKMIEMRVLLILAILVSVMASAEEAALWKDINKQGPNYSSGPDQLTPAGSVVYLTADDGVSGRELWKSDGTGAGTVLVKDVVPGSDSVRFRWLCAVNGSVFFLTGESDFLELWKSDGTSDATRLLKRFDRKTLQYDEITHPRPLNNVLVFLVNSRDTGRELWVSDGTEAGTRILRDIFPGSEGASPFDFAYFRGLLFFSALSPAEGRELWQTDGTEAGTVLFKDIAPGGVSSAPYGLIVFQNVLYFGATDRAHGSELWRCDGTPGSIRLAVDLNPGPQSSNVTPVTVFKQSLLLTTSRGKRLFSMNARDQAVQLDRQNFTYLEGFITTPARVYFRAHMDFGSFHSEFWQTDGTPAGTIAVPSGGGEPFSPPSATARAGSKLLFVSGSQVWVTDGSNSARLSIPVFREGKAFGASSAMLSATTAMAGEELWISNGTVAGTRIVRDIRKGNGSSAPQDLCLFRGALFFTAESGGARYLWKADSAGLHKMAADPVSAIVPLGNKLIVQNAAGLWVNNGTPGNLQLLKQRLYMAASRITVGNRLIFGATYPNDTGDALLWVTDGTAGGTLQLSDQWHLPDYPYPQPIPFLALGSRALIQVQGRDGYVLCSTNGTPAGTQSVKLLGNSYPAYYEAAVFHDRAFFGLSDGLWKTDGTSSNTVKVHDLGGIVLNLASTGSALSGSVLAGNNQSSVWWTQDEKNYVILPFGGKRPSSFVPFGDVMLFNAGKELWRTSGSPESTVLLNGAVNIAYHWNGDVSLPQNRILYGSSLYFQGIDDARGRELWVTDGTAAGTRQVRDIYPGKYDSMPDQFTLSGNAIYFAADDGRFGRELWRLIP